MRSNLPEPDALISPGVAAAWRKTWRLKLDAGDNFIIGITKDNALVARGALPSYQHVEKFAYYMARLGYSAGIAGSGTENCDVVFQL